MAAFLLEDGGQLLVETGGTLLLEAGGPPPPTSTDEVRRQVGQLETASHIAG